ncbi:hypothetical protein QMK17_23940 [Rhodococcus sp. G-MC3]|uniref:hypothetical protein n=1 Tax=Rhodococcus sp. G-MC3 TaxID=3046209 RepID=UPI0024BA6DC9|nr:hypothetical protein [Rhodococcus sp. G-MC3]MDJ0396361.1 hypothetical protein [Rhodococcus sp. G-MC3]
MPKVGYTSIVGQKKLIFPFAGALVILLFIVPLFLGYITVLALLVTATLFLLSTVHPKFAITLWLVVCAFLPFWFGINDPFYMPASSIAGVVVLGGAFLGERWTLSRIDLSIYIFCALCVACGLAGISRPGDVTNVVTQWLLSYLVGRLLVQRAGLEFTFRAIAIIFSAAASFAILEFVFDWNPYYSLVVDNTQYLAWGHEQDRGGIVRAEWAFGHSIALGCSLSLAIPIVFAAKFRPLYRAAMVAVLLGGTVVSFSRSGMLSAVLAIILSLFFYKSGTRSKGKAALVFVFVAVAWFTIPSIVKVFGAEGRRATISSDYRLTLIDLIPSMNPLGLANGYTEPSQGEFYFQGYQSIDSTYVLLGVSFGYVIAALALVGTGWLLWSVLRRTKSAPAVSLVAVTPALFTVALITQFGSLVWFFVGMVSLVDHLGKKELSRNPEISSTLAKAVSSKQSMVPSAISNASVGDGNANRE